MAKKPSRPQLQPGDRVRYDYGGKVGNTGTVVSVHPKKLKTGGSSALVKVRWDSKPEGRAVGTVEERALVLLSEGEDPQFLKAAARMRAWITQNG